MAIGMPYESWTYERRDRLARTKRLLEMWSADPHVREQLMGPSDLTIKAPILATFDTEELNALRNFTSELLRPRNSIREYCCAPVISDYLEYKSFKVEKSERARADAAPADSSWRRWRARQMARCHLTLASELNDAIIHAPFAIELGDGCSVGCNFCGVNAPRLKRNYPLSEDNALLFEGVVRTLSRVAGPASSRHGFLYWASDPFDNPDYEGFCELFRSAVGVFPHTTTAQPLKNISRTRAFLQEASHQPFVSNRFSILSPGSLSRLFDAFSADELLPVELVIHTPGSLILRQLAGRALDRDTTSGVGGNGGQSIACVSGFLVNMVNREVRLISPYPASDTWPNGYRIFASGSFATVADFQSLVSEMIGDHMTPSFRRDLPIKLIDDAQFSQQERGFVISAPSANLECECSPEVALLTAAIARGTESWQTLCDEVSQRHGFSPTSLSTWIDRLYSQGVLEDSDLTRIEVS